MKKVRLAVMAAAIGGLLVIAAVSTRAAGFTNKSLKGTYSFRLTGQKSFSAEDPSVSGLASAPRQDILRVGVFTSDGKGHLTGHTLATTDTNAGATELIDFTWTGTYTINSNGTGSLTVNDPPLGAQTCTDETAATPTPGPCASDDEGAETYSIVINRHGSEKALQLAETDNAGGGAKIFMTGEATVQSGD